MILVKLLKQKTQNSHGFLRLATLSFRSNLGPYVNMCHPFVMHSF